MYTVISCFLAGMNIVLGVKFHRHTLVDFFILKKFCMISQYIIKHLTRCIRPPACLGYKIVLWFIIYQVYQRSWYVQYSHQLAAWLLCIMHCPTHTNDVWNISSTKLFIQRHANTSGIWLNGIHKSVQLLSCATSITTQ